jgi:hypothetical protein
MADITDEEQLQIEGYLDLDHISSEIGSASSALCVVESFREDCYKYPGMSDRLEQMKLKIFEITEYNINKLHSFLP